MQHLFLTCFASMQYKLHVFVRHSRLFPCLSRFRLPSFPFFLSYQTSASKDLGSTLLYALDRCVLLDRLGHGLECLELNSDVARFTTHIKPLLQQIRLLTGLSVGGKTRNIVASFCASFSRSPLLIAFSRAFIPPIPYPFQFSIYEG